MVAVVSSQAKTGTKHQIVGSKTMTDALKHYKISVHRRYFGNSWLMYYALLSKQLLFG